MHTVFLFFFFIQTRIRCCTGVHYIEICFQQKTIRSPTIRVQIGGVLCVEVHIKEVLQSLAFWEHIITNYTIWMPNSLQLTAFHGYIWFWNVLYRLREDRRINFWLKIKVRIMNIGKDFREIQSGPFNMLHLLGNKSSSFRINTINVTRLLVTYSCTDKTENTFWQKTLRCASGRHLNA